jgi:hypothetical protein
VGLAASAVLAAAAYGALFLPAVYFRVAFHIIRRNALVRDRADWPAIRREADALRRAARTPRETYPAIQHVLGRLGDGHSFFISPEARGPGARGRTRRSG